MSAVLPQYVGYVVVLAFGGFFAAVTTLIGALENKFVAGSDTTSESFNTAALRYLLKCLFDHLLFRVPLINTYTIKGRSVKTGLTAAVIVSKWTWAATLLQSSTVANRFGISGPFWYAAGASVQVLLFSVMAIQLKRVAPNAHTFLEIIRARYGNTSHKVFLFFGLMTNIIVTAMLLLGGSVVVNKLTGMPVVAASFLIPIGIISYTMHGGLKASFIADYLHTVIIYLMLLVFSGTVYMWSDSIGSADRMWDLLHEVSEVTPVKGNAGGSYLTMDSEGGLIFGVINILGNFGTIFVDQVYWQSAIASNPQGSVKGFLIGGLSWFSIPFTLATSVGLASVALKIPLSDIEVYVVVLELANRCRSEGLVVPATVVELMGNGGAVAALTMLFMAVTSSGSAELIAVSSLITYDIYWTYINPNADGKKLLYVSRMMVVGFGLFMGVLATFLLYLKLSLGFIYLLMGVMIGSAVVPVALTIMWSKASTVPVTVAPVVGFVLGLFAWLFSAQRMYNEITLETASKDMPLLIGNLVSIVTGGVICVVGSLISPANFDFQATKQIKQIDGARASKRIELLTTAEDTDYDDDPAGEEAADAFAEEESLKASLAFSLKAGFIGTLILCICWPLPLYFSRYVFSKAFFNGWIVLSFLWAIVAAAVIIFLPLIEARRGFIAVFLGLFRHAEQHISRSKYETPGSLKDFVWGLIGGISFPVLAPLVVYFMDDSIFMMLGALVASAVDITITGIFLMGNFSDMKNVFLAGEICLVIGLVGGLLSVGYYGYKLHRSNVTLRDIFDQLAGKGLNNVVE